MKKNLVRSTVTMVLLVASEHPLQANWVQASGTENQFVLTFTLNDNLIFAGTGEHGVFRSIDNGVSWTSSSFYQPVSCLALSGSTVIAGTNGKGVYRSIDAGTHWSPVDSGLHANSKVLSLAVSGKNIFAGTDSGGIFLSTDNGTSWKAASTGLPANAKVSSLAASGSNIFAGTYGAGAFLSTNIGTSWAAINSGLPNDKYVNFLAVSGSNIYAGTYGGVFLSTNNGIGWTPITASLIDLLMSNIGSIAVKGTYIFASSGGSVFLSTDHGTNWIDDNAGLPDDIHVWCLAISNGIVFAGTFGDGVWCRPISEMAGVIDHPFAQRSRSTEFKIRFSHACTTIDFALQRPEKVTVSVYNLVGHEIAFLVNRTCTSGLHSVTWDTRLVATGRYVVRMQSGGRSSLKSVSIVR
jgi:photosystem II stability/assembly factor-like uncharacterized protein